MIVKDLSNSFNPIPKKIVEKKKEVTKIKGKKHKQTKEKEIPKKVKETVWKRDKHKCIFCGKLVDIFYANAHFIPRSAGGLGIEENIFTACEDCHREYDNSDKRQSLKKVIQEYLKQQYGEKWKKENLVYNKWKNGKT